MQLVNVNCSNCGELLSIPESVKLATCIGCEMPMAIKQTDSVIFTEPMLLSRPDNLEVVPYEKPNADLANREIKASDRRRKVEYLSKETYDVINGSNNTSKKEQESWSEHEDIGLNIIFLLAVLLIFALLAKYL